MMGRVGMRQSPWQSRDTKCASNDIVLRHRGAAPCVADAPALAGPGGKAPLYSFYSWFTASLQWILQLVYSVVYSPVKREHAFHFTGFTDFAAHPLVALGPGEGCGLPTPIPH